MNKKVYKKVENGNVYGKLTVIRYDSQDKHYRKKYLCKCECGNEKVILGNALSSKNTRSCGCLKPPSTRKPNNGGELTAIILGYQNHAKKRGFTWNLTREEVEYLIKQNCYYCGIEPSNLKKTKNSIDGLKYNGIDRVDSSKGYYTDNCVACCRTCNLAKRDMKIEDFRSWVLQLVSHVNKW